MPFAISIFKTEDRRGMNEIINEFRVIMKKELEICSLFIFWMLVRY